jgi:hypothetical protein
MERRRENPLLPLVFDGRGAATAARAGRSGGLRANVLRGGCAGGRRSSVAAREGVGEKVGLTDPSPSHGLLVRPGHATQTCTIHV